jgi:hypothetical protein
MSNQPDPPAPVETPAPTAAPATPPARRARLADDGTPLPKHGTRPIGAARLPAGAAAALGGPPLAPPLPRARTAERPMAAAPRIDALGNPSFDPPSPETVATRQAIDEVKASCRALIASIRRTREVVLPLLQTLAKRASEVKTREDFDPAEVERFLQDCDAAIEKLKK